MQTVLENIQAIFAFQNATIHKIVCNKRKKSASFYMITDKTYTKEDVNEVEKILQTAIPATFTLSIHIQKSIADAELIKNAILAFITKQTLLSIFIQKEDISIIMDANNVICQLHSTESEYSYLQNNHTFLEELQEYLRSQFCNNIQIEYILDLQKENVMPKLQEVEDDSLEEQKIRTFAIEDFVAIDKKDIVQQATYIADCTFIAENLTICGEIIDIKLSISKAEKEYLRLTINDKSGIMQTCYFFKKRTKEEIDKLQIGDFITCTGKNEIFNNTLSFTTQYINKGRYPQNFVPTVKKGRNVSANYKIVYPEKIVDYNQINIFEKEFLPKEFVENSFVVFDIETTGLVNDPLTGKMDTVTEIGAVKIIDAEITEKFSVLIDPKRKLDPKIIALTGITDEMLIGQPTIDKVVGDFYKFCYGAVLVAHNIPFDFKFMKYYCEQENYILENKRIDTVTFAQEMLSLANYKLNTVANHFNITFNHHRAFDDALTTAKIFIELVKLKKGLPMY